jgi:urea transport system substrate-binding protein
MNLKSLLSRSLALLAALAAVAAAPPASAAGVIKVGVLHSLSGTMAISEEPLKDTILMMIKRQNAKGGLLGKKIVPVVVDPASNWPLFAEKAQELLEKDKVSVVFGCWTSVSRKSVLPVFEKDDGLLFYPVQWEGEESSRNIIYTGATPNQQAIPAVQYLMKQMHVKRWALIGTDYVYPRTTNKILEAYLEAHGVKPSDIMVRYTPFGFSDWQSIVAEVKQFGSQGKKTAVVSTINGDANVPFYKELANQHITAEDIPVMAFSVGEQELSGLDTKPLVGHLAAWNYFMSVRRPQNMKMIREWHAYIGNDKRVFNDPMEASVIGFRLWVKAVQKVHSTNVDKVIAALPGLAVPNLTGGMAKVLPNHMITKPVLIGEIRPNGQFNVVWRTKGEVPGAAWSAYLPEDKNVISDWVHVKCGHYDTATKVCSGK